MSNLFPNLSRKISGLREMIHRRRALRYQLKELKRIRERLMYKRKAITSL
ncbi:MAG: hypothetical protein PHT49_07040 [Desulfovibrionales bacterium]|nr:hypothetical protein [Desulfovibrionales bacterium]